MFLCIYACIDENIELEVVKFEKKSVAMILVASGRWWKIAAIVSPLSRWQKLKVYLDSNVLQQLVSFSRKRARWLTSALHRHPPCAFPFSFLWPSRTWRLMSPRARSLCKLIQPHPLQARHCNYELFAVSGYPDYIEEDFNFTIVPGVLAMSSPCLFLCYCLL